MREVILEVNGREYRGWKDIRITRSIESLSGSFAMSVSERWQGQRDPWPIVEGDECVVRLGEDVIVSGYVDIRTMSLSANDHSFTVQGRDKAADLIDCSAVLKDWEFVGVGVLEIAQRVAAPFGIAVSLAEGVTTPPPARKLVINPGDSAYDVIDRACRLAGLFAVSDGNGNVMLTRAGTAKASTQLVVGKNILDATANYDQSACYAQYIVIGQQQGGESLFGAEAADVRAQSVDQNARRKARVLMIRGEGSISIQQAQDRANWEAAIRRARALEVAATVQGWEQASGELWPVNAEVIIDAPVLGVVGPMLITEVAYLLSEAGTTTELTLRLPGAFEPQPEIPENEEGTQLFDGGEE